jgi:hypothetical protein
MSESFVAEIAYKCDLCGELFSSPAEAENHNLKSHRESGLKDHSDRGLWTSTPAEDREEERAR